MGDLEHNSRGQCSCDGGFRGLPPLRLHHAGGDTLQRHRHDMAFAALVLAGGYIEAGDQGRHRVVAGDVILHRPYESHLDRFDAVGAEVMTLPLLDPVPSGVIGRVGDPDAIVRLAERDRRAAAQCLVSGFVALERTPEDWPDLLASDLLADPDQSIARWALDRGLHPGSIARGFRQQFGISAASFRRNVRVHRALRDICGSALSLVFVAADHGFADQAHMTRAITGISGLTPGRMRRDAVPVA